jgi:hypothetical protein
VNVWNSGPYRTLGSDTDLLPLHSRHVRKAGQGDLRRPIYNCTDIPLTRAPSNKPELDRNWGAANREHTKPFLLYWLGATPPDLFRILLACATGLRDDHVESLSTLRNKSSSIYYRACYLHALILTDPSPVRQSTMVDSDVLGNPGPDYRSNGLLSSQARMVSPSIGSLPSGAPEGMVGKHRYERCERELRQPPGGQP